MIDGSPDNSLLNLIFGYNGFGRIVSGGGAGGGGGAGFSGATGLFRLFNDLMGGQASWLLPAALLALVAGVVWRGRAPRTDRTRAALLLWGGWLVVTGAVFSFGQGVIHTYYTVALAPAIGALVGIGGAPRLASPGSARRPPVRRGCRRGHRGLGLRPSRPDPRLRPVAPRPRPRRRCARRGGPAGLPLCRRRPPAVGHGRVRTGRGRRSRRTNRLHADDRHDRPYRQRSVRRAGRGNCGRRRSGRRRSRRRSPARWQRLRWRVPHGWRRSAAGWQ